MKMKFFRIPLVIILLCCLGNAFAQLSAGNKHFRREQYRLALPYYEKVLAEKPEDPEMLFRTGVCYLNLFSKEKGLEYIEQAYQADPKADRYIKYWLGVAYHHNYKFEKARDFLKDYQKSLFPGDPRKKEVDLLLTYIDNAEKLYNDPKKVVIENIGEGVNTEFSEHSPALSKNDSVLYFTSRRNTTLGGDIDVDGEFFEDIFESRMLSSGEWMPSEHVHLNTKKHDATVMLFEDDKKLLMYRNTDNGDLYFSNRVGDNEWEEPVEFPGINSTDYEADAYISRDGSIMVFATDHYTQGDNLDLYMVRKDPNGEWGEPYPLDNINTPYDEDAPFLTRGEDTLYFSSRSEKSMGGYDVFMAVKEGDEYSDPVNMGYPINTPDDDTYYHAFSATEQALLSSFREGTKGEKIYI